jgi:hypothetical protein
MGLIKWSCLVFWTDTLDGASLYAVTLEDCHDAKWSLLPFFCLVCWFYCTMQCCCIDSSSTAYGLLAASKKRALFCLKLTNCLTESVIDSLYWEGIMQWYSLLNQDTHQSFLDNEKWIICQYVGWVRLGSTATLDRGWGRGSVLDAPWDGHPENKITSHILQLCWR